MADRAGKLKRSFSISMEFSKASRAIKKEAAKTEKISQNFSLKSWGHGEFIDDAARESMRRTEAELVKPGLKPVKPGPDEDLPRDMMRPRQAKNKSAILKILIVKNFGRLKAFLLSGRKTVIISKKNNRMKFS